MQLNGPVIVEIREQLGMSQRDLARAAGLNPSALCQYEQGVRGNKRHTGRGGRLHPSVGVRIARALGVKLSAITREIPEPEPDTEVAA